MDLSRRTVLLGVPALAAAVLTTPAAAAPRNPGADQSPIHLRSRDAVIAPDLPALEVDYPSHVDLRVRYVRKDQSAAEGCSARGAEETVEAEVPEGAAGIRIGGTRYTLLQFHFHTPAEHQLDWNRFPIEQHFVHRGPDGETLVLGLFLAPGGSGGTVQDAVLAGMPQECGPEREVSGDLAAALPRTLSTFRYVGSTTTAPYSEPVTWLVLSKRRLVTASSVKAYRDLFPEGDAREPQPVNGRVVQFRPQ